MRNIRWPGQLRYGNLLVLLIIFLASAQSVCAREPAPSNAKRPKIGLVLGGGGARGAAHIGVLKVLEENRVPVDFIVGTSMGTVVGGLYASGMSPAEIEENIKRIDWVEMFKDRPGEESLSFRYKRDQQRLMSIEFGVKNGAVQLPIGVMAGQKLGFELQKLTLPVAQITDFDKLSYPFRAAATDLRTGTKVVLKRGSLAEAMRASMSVPGVWPPVELDGHLLVDGFLVANVPVEVAKELGADIIIAVDVGAPPAENTRFGNVIDVIGQMTSILSQQNVDKSLSLLTDSDGLIHPKLSGISPDSFTNMPEAIKRGEEAARALAAKLKRYSVPESEYTIFLSRHRRHGSFHGIIHEIRICGLRRVSEATVRGRIHTQAGKPLDIRLLEEDITRIYAMNDFESVGFGIVGENGKNILVISPEEKPWGPDYLRFGLNLAGDTSASNEFTVLADYRRTQLNTLGAEWKNVVQLGETRGILSEWYQPLDTRDYFFAAPYARFHHTLVDAYQGNERIATYGEDTLAGGAAMGVNFSSYAQSRVEYITGVLNAKPSTGGTTLPEFDQAKQGALQCSFDYDQLDNHNFPKRGIKSVTQYYGSSDSLGGDYSYGKFDFTFTKVTTLVTRHTFIAGINIGTTLDSEAPYYDQYSVGGFLNLSGYGAHQLVGQQKTLGQLLYYYRSGRNVYLGAGAEYGNVWDKWNDIRLGDMLISGVLFVGIDSPLGPLYLGFAQAERNHGGRIYLYLGKTF